MKNHLWLALSVLAVAAAWGCNDEIKVENRTFQQLCEMSGGEIDESSNRVCKCGQGNSKIACMPGVVCDNNGEYCANSNTECNKDRLGLVSCSNELVDSNCNVILKENENGDSIQISGVGVCTEFTVGGNVKYRYMATDDTTIFSGYNDNVDKINGYCVDNDKWTSCNNQICGECQDKAWKCDGGTIYNETGGILEQNTARMYECIEGVWNYRSDCAYKSCNAEKTECGVCEDGATQCVERENSAEIKICKDGVWNVKEECANVSCDASGTICGSCKIGTVKCENDVRYECINGAWLNAIVCPGNVSCTDLNTIIDNEDKNINWFNKKCGECRNNDQRCIPGNSAENNAVIQECVDGQWKNKIDDEANSVVCPTSACDITGKVCDACINGETQCLNDDKIVAKLYTCSGNKWSTTPCYYSCNRDGNACGDCVNGEKKCISDENGDSEMVCIEGAWGNSDGIVGSKDACKDSSCKMKDLEDNGKEFGECGVCVNDSSKCENNEESIGVMKHCVNGDWIENICDDNVSCNADGTECGGCKDNTTKCFTEQKLDDDGNPMLDDNDNPIYEIKTQICTNATWGSFPIGEEGTAIAGEKSLCTDINENHDVSCSMDNPETESELGHCGICKDGATKCEEEDGSAVMKICENGDWIINSNVSECKYSCNADAGCGECLNGKLKCESGKLFKCESGKWDDGSVCENAASCVVITANDEIGDYVENKEGTIMKCGACEDDKDKFETLDNGACQHSKCQDGLWNVVETKEFSCNAGGTDFGACLNNSVRCEDNEKIGQLKQCTNGAWTDLVSCNDKSCNATMSACGECMDGSLKCNEEERKSYVCVNGSWVDKNICHYGCGATDCLECAYNSDETKNAKKCENSVNGIGVLYRCVEGNIWGEGVPDPNGNSCNNNGYGECLNNTIICENDQNSNKGTLTYCINGVFGNKHPCGDVSCNETGNACGECKNETTKCENDNISKVGYFSVCRSGSWNTGLCSKTSYGGYPVCNNNIQYASMCKDSSQCGDCNHLIGEEWKGCYSNFKFKCTVENILEYDN